MSAYDDYDEPRRYRTIRTRPRDRDEPDFVREETFLERSKGPGPRDLVFRPRDNDEYSATPRRIKSAAGYRGYDDYDDDGYTGYAAAGNAAGRRKGRNRDHERRRRDDRDYDSEYSRSSPRRERRKSAVGGALQAVGLGGVAAAVGNKFRDRSSDRSVGSKSTRRGRRDSSSLYSRSRSRGGNEKNKSERQWAQAAQAALIAGAAEAFPSSKEPGSWTGEKGKRIATAAIGAGGIDKFIDRNPDEKSKRHLAEAVVGGLAANRLANGPRSKSRCRNAGSRPGFPDSFHTGRFAHSGARGRSSNVVDQFRGRSQSRGRADSPKGHKGGGNGESKGLLADGTVAAASKAVYDRMRPESRKRRSPSSTSADSYMPSRTRRRDRRRSPFLDAGNTRRGQGGTDRGRGLGSRDAHGDG